MRRFRDLFCFFFLTPLLPRGGAWKPVLTRADSLCRKRGKVSSPRVTFMKLVERDGGGRPWWFMLLNKSSKVRINDTGTQCPETISVEMWCRTEQLWSPTVEKHHNGKKWNICIQWNEQREVLKILFGFTDSIIGRHFPEISPLWCHCGHLYHSNTCHGSVTNNAQPAVGSAHLVPTAWPTKQQF